MTEVFGVVKGHVAKVVKELINEYGTSRRKYGG